MGDEVLLRIEGLKKHFPITRGLLRRRVDDVKAAMRRASPKTADRGYGLLRWSLLGG